MSKLLRLVGDEAGATAIEYAVIAALISIAAVAAMTNIGSALKTTFNNVATDLAP